MDSNNSHTKQQYLAYELIYEEDKYVALPVVSGKSVKESYQEMYRAGIPTSGGWYYNPDAYISKKISNVIVHRTERLTFQIRAVEIDSQTIDINLRLIFDNEAAIANVRVDKSVLIQVRLAEYTGSFKYLLDSWISDLIKTFNKSYGNIDEISKVTSKIFNVEEKIVHEISEKLVCLTDKYQPQASIPVLIKENVSSHIKPVQLNLF